MTNICPDGRVRPAISRQLHSSAFPKWCCSTTVRSTSKSPKRSTVSDDVRMAKPIPSYEGTENRQPESTFFECFFVGCEDSMATLQNPWNSGSDVGWALAHHFASKTLGGLPRHNVAERRSREAHPTKPMEFGVRCRVGLGPPLSWRHPQKSGGRSPRCWSFDSAYHCGWTTVPSLVPLSTTDEKTMNLPPSVSVQTSM
jgi:hypothetical protein